MHKFPTLIGKYPALALLATAVLALIAVSFAANKLAAVFVMSVVMGLQVVLGGYDRVEEWLKSVEYFEPGVQLEPRPPYRKRAPLLACIPLLLAVYAPLGWLALLAVVIWLARPMWKLGEAYLHRSQRHEQQLARLASYQPRVAAHLAGSRGVAYQVNQWLPVLEALNVPVLIIVRERRSLHGIDQTSIPLVFVRTAKDIEDVFNQGIKTVLYPANPMKNLQLFRHYRVNHFFINHGESDKAVNQSKLLMAYDKLLVGGPQAERRLRHAGLPIRDGQVVYVGRPQAEMLLDKVSPAGGLRTILYAPTWEGFVEEANYSSIGPLALQIFEQLEGHGYRILFKPHPYTGLRDQSKRNCLARIKALCERDGHEYIDAASPIYELMNRSDAMVTDISSVLVDYLVTGKPMILCLNEHLKRKLLAREFPSAAAAYQYIDDGPAIPVLLQLIDEGDPLAEQRTSVRSDYFGNFEESALARFKKVVENSVADKPICGLEDRVATGGEY